MLMLMLLHVSHLLRILKLYILERPKGQRSGICSRTKVFSTDVNLDPHGGAKDGFQIPCRLAGSGLWNSRLHEIRRYRPKL